MPRSLNSSSPGMPSFRRRTPVAMMMFSAERVVPSARTSVRAAKSAAAISDAGPQSDVRAFDLAKDAVAELGTAVEVDARVVLYRSVDLSKLAAGPGFRARRPAS